MEHQLKQSITVAHPHPSIPAFSCDANVFASKTPHDGYGLSVMDAAFLRVTFMTLVPPFFHRGPGGEKEVVAYDTQNRWRRWVVSEHVPCVLPRSRVWPSHIHFHVVAFLCLLRPAGCARSWRFLHLRMPRFNLLVLHYSYFIGVCLITGLVFRGSSTPAMSVSYTDSGFSRHQHHDFDGTSSC